MISLALTQIAFDAHFVQAQREIAVSRQTETQTSYILKALHFSTSLYAYHCISRKPINRSNIYQNTTLRKTLLFPL